MSSFPGRMQEYAAISIDRFDGDNLKSTAFFLSHYHGDHVVGLSDPKFVRRLQEDNDFHLYCSDITKTLILANDDYKPIKPHIVALPVDQSTTIKIPDLESCIGQDVVVTLIPAGHCLGSVMFLFEGCEGTVLYTGDFRLPLGSASRIQHLHSGSRPKSLKSMYVDTTFCVPEARHIPERDKSVNAVISLVDEWIHISPSHSVHLQCRARFSYEYLYERLYDTFKMKVHVQPFQLAQYGNLPFVSKFLTTDPSETKIHSCYCGKIDRKTKDRLPCGHVPKDSSDLKLRLIKPSTMWFTNRAVSRNDIIVNTTGIDRVCYCFHSSDTEIQDFVSYLKPDNVYPNVKPATCSMNTVEERLQKFLTTENFDQNLPVTPCKDEQPLGMIRKRRLSSGVVYRSCDDDDDFDSGVISSNKRVCQKSSTENDLFISPTKSVASFGSEYRSFSGSELDLFSDEEKEDAGAKSASQQSLLAYISDDEDCLDRIDNAVGNAECNERKSLERTQTGIDGNGIEFQKDSNTSESCQDECIKDDLEVGRCVNYETGDY
ncbi:protein artemis-like [Tubulanus polymorphus]|uniref:protein artemis-like n=1 Tax=Tubulanus polymorphus TaxID=672921 RepID=UPI003DA2AABD